MPKSDVRDHGTGAIGDREGVAVTRVRIAAYRPCNDETACVNHRAGPGHQKAVKQARVGTANVDVLARRRELAAVAHNDGIILAADPNPDLTGRREYAVGIGDQEGVIRTLKHKHPAGRHVNGAAAAHGEVIIRTAHGQGGGVANHAAAGHDDGITDAEKSKGLNIIADECAG